MIPINTDSQPSTIDILREALDLIEALCDDVSAVKPESVNKPLCLEAEKFLFNTRPKYC